MIISNKIDLISYIQKKQLQKETLFVSPVFTEEQKAQLSACYDQQIAISETALQNLVAKENVVTEPQTL